MRVKSLGALLAAVAVAACSSDDPTGPTGTGPGGSLSVTQYMDSALSLMEGFSVNRSINWTTFRATWRQAAAGKSTYRDLYPIIAQALAQLDPHSSIAPPDKLPGSTDAPTDRPDLRVQSRLVAPRVGYVWVPGFVGKSQAGRIDSTHAALRELDASDPCGWIVDLRANNGGFFFALMASVGPLYATSDPYVGGDVYPGDYRTLWYYRQRGANDVFGVSDGRDSAQITVPNPWRPKRPGLPVAVLHSTATNSQGQYTSLTASAGESITLAFRGGPPSRSFGLPTFGVASGRQPFFMPDSARIDITESYMADRRGYTPGDKPIPPDETIASPSPLRIGDSADPVIAAATKWLQSRPECGGSSAQQGGLPSARTAPLQLPPVPPLQGPHRLPNPRSIY